MMEQRQNSIYPANLTDLLAVSYQHNVERLALSDGDEKFHDYAATDGFVENSDRFVENSSFVENSERFENNDHSSSPVSTLDDCDSSQYGVDLTGKGTNLAGKSFTIAAILGLTNGDEDVMNLSVQERFQNQRHLQSYLYAGHDVQRLNEGFRSRSKRIRTIFTPEQLERLEAEFERQQYMVGPERLYLAHALQLTEAQVIRTLFTPEQLERLEAEFERQQYMVGPERLYLAHALQLTEAQVIRTLFTPEQLERLEAEFERQQYMVKVWFQNRRIKWRKHHLEVTQQRLAVLQRRTLDPREDAA
ncbi:Uncharacterized protein OBRU01_00407 [Operophtera brumata]|uniref:Homeobox domain-containing protein n=1 Tax=Operophtera brumata TaxID=104452 RepID=A0A0L7LRA3_OPEBR|nr:Uncharacterized protein OBRU01_00407 [Operophtera brumata]